MATTEQQFSDLLSNQNIEISDIQQEQFRIYYEQLILWNEKMNLTGITAKEQVYTKHFYDSISLSFYINMASILTIADIGSGAGFPCIPLKIMYPHIKVTIVDSLNKRIQFLNLLIETIGLKDIKCLHGRAEDIGRDPKVRGQFDLVTARAVAKLNVLNELCLPFVKRGGVFVSMKGTEPEIEIKEAAYSMKELKAELIHVYKLNLPFDEAQRHIIVLKKIEPTPAKYPRKAGIPLKSPL
jgi:16S rRNA (guanine527-N7)-methyltransferase